MQTKKPGTALLVVLLIIGGMLLYATFLWYQVFLLQEIAYRKEQYEQMFHLTEGALHVGIFYGKKYVPLLTGKQKKPVLVAPIVLSLNPWPSPSFIGISPTKSDVRYHARVTIDQVTTGIRICAYLYTRNGELVQKHSCIVQKNGELNEWNDEM